MMVFIRRTSLEGRRPTAKVSYNFINRLKTTATDSKSDSSVISILSSA